MRNLKLFQVLSRRFVRLATLPLRVLISIPPLPGFRRDIKEVMNNFRTRRNRNRNLAFLACPGHRALVNRPDGLRLHLATNRWLKELQHMSIILKNNGVNHTFRMTTFPLRQKWPDMNLRQALSGTVIHQRALTIPLDILVDPSSNVSRPVMPRVPAKRLM